MAIERTWKQISAVPFTADGQANGIVTIQDTSCFKVNMAVVINAVGKEPLRLGVKRVIDNKMLIVGPENKSVHSKYDISAYVLGINPTIEAPEQSRPEIPPADYERAVYEEEPTVAKRVVDVNKQGDIYSLDNPKPILPVGFSQDDSIKKAIVCASDLVRDMTWAEIDGVRRVTQIVFTADSVDEFFEVTAVLTRDFTYQTVDPFDLIKIEDTLDVT